jgi:hypothetical protein
MPGISPTLGVPFRQKSGVSVGPPGNNGFITEDSLFFFVTEDNFFLLQE